MARKLARRCHHTLRNLDDQVLAPRRLKPGLQLPATLLLPARALDSRPTTSGRTPSRQRDRHLVAGPSVAEHPK
jgi:hypothetical protein